MKQTIPFLFLSLIFSAVRVHADPELFVSDPEINFGEARSGEVLEKHFALENRGNETLKILDIKTSCGCTVPENKTMLILAGEKKDLKVVLDLKGKSGPQIQHITLVTNDPQKPRFSLKISGEAVPNIRVEPRTLNLMQQDPDSPHQGEVLLSSTRGEKFEVRKVTANRDKVTAEVLPAADGLSARILVTPRPQEGQGHFTDVLTIETSDAKGEPKRVMVMWQISTGISVAPAQVNLVPGPENQLIDRYLMVRGYPGLKEPLKVTAVEWPGQDVEIGLTDTKKFGWRIHLKQFRPTSEMKDSEIVVHTNAEGFETLKVPVRILEK